MIGQVPPIARINNQSLTSNIRVDEAIRLKDEPHRVGTHLAKALNGLIFDMQYSAGQSHDPRRVARQRNDTSTTQSGPSTDHFQIGKICASIDLDTAAVDDAAGQLQVSIVGGPQNAGIVQCGRSRPSKVEVPTRIHGDLAVGRQGQGVDIDVAVNDCR